MIPFESSEIFTHQGIIVRYVDDNLATGCIAWAENTIDIAAFTAAIEDHFTITGFRQKPLVNNVPQFEGGAMKWCAARFFIERKET